ncbi:hypothetical protein B0T24DRAFT_539940 [Lasiosphaeria ovina]|uniref:Oxidoreductase AflY n=1 Tax=Lasiosphaeria ovina TaxID=92902 RepID=A0AAE0JSF4_9PEZI|nr:hypothetical protein B0T24DRAFT_539940 [Lasiosphaeria ovina]
MIDTDDFAISAVETPGLLHVPNLTNESAKETEELLKDNNRRYHIFFTLEDHMGTLFNRCLGKEEHYRNFEMFFLNMFKKIGWQATLQKYLLDGGPVADDMLCRVYMGYVHGLIHIGLAVEFRQPRLLAEGLAQAAVHHDGWYTEYLTTAEAAAKEAKESPLPLSTLVDMARQDPKISTASSWTFQTQTRRHSGRWAMDKEVARDGILANAKPQLVRLAARWRVASPDKEGDDAYLERKTAELMNTAVYIVAAAQNPPYECTFDFFLLHCATAAIAHAALLRESSMTWAQKARLLEFSGRVFMMTYSGMGAPQLRLDYLASHRSRLGAGQSWDDVFARACEHADDGHMIKLIRSTKLAEEMSRPYDHLPEFRVKQPMFLKAAIAMIDSGTERPMTWTKHWDFIRFCGFPEAWERFPKRNY